MGGAFGGVVLVGLVKLVKLVKTVKSGFWGWGSKSGFLRVLVVSGFWWFSWVLGGMVELVVLVGLIVGWLDVWW